MKRISATKTALAVLSCSAASASVLFGQHTEKPGEQQVTDVDRGYADVNGLKMYYEVHGAGPGTPLLLLHGAFGTAQGWNSMLSGLSAGRRVIVVELEGHGHTRDLERPLTYARMADDAAALLKSLNIEQADVFGYSMGGVVALGLALRHPQQVRKVAILGSHFRAAKDVYEPESYEQYQSIGPDFAPPVLKQPYDRVAPDPQRWPILVSKIKEMGRDFAGYDVDKVRQIKAPVLIMQGDRDVVRVEHAVEIFRLIHHAQLAVFPGADHFVTWAAPDLVVATLRPFFDAPMPGGPVAGAASSPQTVTSRDGTVIAFEQSGSGPVLILVGGALADRSGAARMAGLLAPHFTVINYDRRGRGDSGDTQPYAVQREVEDIEALIDQAGGSAYLFGASSGAALVLEAASKLSGKVKKAVLFEPPFIVDQTRPGVPADFLDKVGALLAEGRRGDAVEYFMTTAVGIPAAMAAQMRSSPMWARLEQLAHTLPYDGAVMGDTLSGRALPAARWSTAACPILVLCGGLSDPWLKKSTEQLAGILPKGRHQVLEGQNHSATFMAPQVFVPVLVEFFGTD